MTDYAEKNFPAEQSSPGKNSRLQSSYVDKGRAFNFEEAPGKRPQAVDAISLLGAGLTGRKQSLRNSAEFRLVYEKGDRYDGYLMSIFITPNSLNFHRFGVTASRKMSHQAVKRNRAKRLLRETFRLSGEELNRLQHRYDWVFNAKRAILQVKLDESVKEFHKVIGQVGSKELETS